MEAAAPHPRRDGRHFTLVLAGFHLQRAALSAVARAAAAHPQAQLQGFARPSSPLRGAKGQRPPAARPTASPLRFPSTPVKVCAPPITSPTTRPATPRSRSTSTRSICSFPSGSTSTRPSPRCWASTTTAIREYPIIDGAAVHDPDDGNKIKRVIQAAKEDTEIFPHLNNFNPNTQSWDPASATCSKTRKRAALRQQIVRFFTAYPAIAAFRWTLKACPTMPARPT
jgi:hypothetical protein